jgi:hypothetical protein
VDATNPSEPTWSGPGDFGQPAAFDAKIGVATPLLAGFSLALLGVVGQASKSFRWPGLTMTVLLSVCVLLVACVQFGFRGRALLYSKADVDAWGRLTDLTKVEEAALRAQVQAADMAAWRVWHRRTQLTYNFGIVLLALGLAFTLAPPTTYDGGALLGEEVAWRWIGYTIGLVAAASELIWVLADEMRGRQQQRLLQQILIESASPSPTASRHGQDDKDGNNDSRPLRSDPLRQMPAPGTGGEMS